MAEKIEKKIDAFGFEYFDRIPDGYRLAVMDDFHRNGRKILGKLFLIQWVHKPDYYQICVVSENLKGSWLMPFIDAGRVFINITDDNNNRQ